MLANGLALGTVQFGLPYGIANRGGKTCPDEVSAVLAAAAVHGIDTLDTAIGYGDSEAILGRAGVAEWRIITKLPGLPADESDVASWVEREISGSLTRLRVGRLHGVLLHRPLDLLGSRGEALFDALAALKRTGATGKIGVSVYGPEDLDLLAEFPFDLVQAPLNILDRRLIDSNWMQRLKDRGVELHVRSVFLQGLLLMSATERPEKFARWQPIWSYWDAWLVEHGLTPLQACLGCLASCAPIDRLVVGAADRVQLDEIVAAARCHATAWPDWPQPPELDLINPAHWDRLD
jgi:aryl-alcohol dehydrogenase-like predicted oxidoreductase